MAASSPNRLPPFLGQIFDEALVHTKDNEPRPLGSNISSEEAATLFDLVRQERPACTAEVGFAQGISALAILAALEENQQGTHHVIDPFQANFEDIGLAMVERAQLSSRLQFYRKFPEEVIPALPTLQFAFIDASHLFDLTLLEFVLMDKRLEVGGHLAFHDLWMPSLQKLLRYILSNRSYEVVHTRQITHFSLGSKVRGLLSGIPRIERILSPESLRPWASFGVDNMVVLRKTAQDERDWRFHSTF